jgi:hypothetical protein
VGKGYLSVKSILDPRLLIAAPAFAKYSFSFLARDLFSTSILYAIIGFLTYFDIYERAGGGRSVAFVDVSLEEQISNILITILISALSCLVGLWSSFFSQYRMK